MSLLWILAAATLSLPEHVPAQRMPERWTPLRSLVGTWEGSGEGFGARSTVSHQWEFVIAGNFLRLRTRSVSVASNIAEDLHEDVGYMSYDADVGGFVFRQFMSEGYVNTYDVLVTGDHEETIDFEYRGSESAGGMRAQMRLVFVDQDEYEMVLELANPGEDFVACQWMRMKRTIRSP